MFHFNCYGWKSDEKKVLPIVVFIISKTCPLHVHCFVVYIPSRDDSCALMLDAGEVPCSIDTPVHADSIPVKELRGKHDCSLMYSRTSVHVQ